MTTQIDIIEANHGDVFWDALACFLDGRDSPKSCLICPSKNCIDLQSLLQPATYSFPGVSITEAAVPNQLGIEGDVVVAQ